MFFEMKDSAVGLVKSSKVMSKKNLVAYPSYESAWLLFDWNVKDIEGKILTLIETLGLKDTQEKATKDMARNIVQSIYRDGHYMYSDFVSKFMKEKVERGNLPTQTNVPRA